MVRSGAGLDAVVIGNATIDLVWDLQEPLVVDHKMVAGAFARYPGGQAANVAYTLARLGFRVEFAGRFGGDKPGALCRDALRQAGASLTASVTSSGCTMQTAAILVEREAGTRTIALHRPAGLAPLCRAAVGRLCQSARLVYVDGHEAALQHAVLGGAAAEKRLRVADIEVADTATQALVPEVEHLIVPQAVATRLAGRDDPAAAVTALASRGPQVVIATHGAQALLIAGAGERARAQAVTQTEVVDTTGVGDAFRAAYCAGLLVGLDLGACIDIAVAAAHWKCRAPGPRISDAAAFDALRRMLTARTCP